MVVLRSLVYTIIFYGLTVPIVICAVPVALFPRLLKPYVHGWVHFHHWCARLLLGIRLKVEGEIPDGHVLVAAKHEAAYETMELVRLLNEPVVVLKAELANIPLWGWVAQRYGMIPVDRDASTRALRAMLKAADAARESGRPVAIFPEGTRVPHGETPPVRSGFAGLYRHLGLPVVPVALDAGKLWRRNSFLKQSGTITIRFGEVIPSGLPRQEAEARVHAAINALNSPRATA
jgi:1-acyl-sn-glycerol-3-phosphate acyltransferase